eukprot:12499257-Ditylum_brightwellii.AAC.1
MQAKWANFFNNYRTSAIVSYKERQGQHQDIDAATRIQSISCRFIHQKQMITEHTTAVIIQTNFQIFHQQHTLQDNNDDDNFFTYNGNHCRQHFHHDEEA